MTATILDGVRAGVRAAELAWAAAEQQELELTEAERWARDPLGWIRAHAWIASPFQPGQVYDDAWWAVPKRKLAAARFDLYDLQEATIRAWIDLPHLAATGELFFRDAAVEKSRQLGETWAPAAVIDWALHYHWGVLGLVMSKVGADVDDGGGRNTIDSIFGRVRYIEQRLGSTDGSTLTADRRRVPGCQDGLVFRPFSRDPAKIENPTTGSVVLGASQTDNPGRGKTLTFAAVDEAAFVEHGEKVYSALDEACPSGKLLVSTVNGDGNFHARICDEKPAGYTVLRLHWSQHPIYRLGSHIAGDDPDCPRCAATRAKVAWSSQQPVSHRYPGRLTSPYYDARVVGKTDEQVANELDIDRERALPGRVYSEFDTGAHVVLDGIAYDEGLPLELFWDYGLDLTAVVVCQDAPHDFRVIGLLEVGQLVGSTATPERVSAALVEHLRALGVEERLLERKWLRHIHAVGDPSGHGSDLQTARPFVEAYAKHGWQIGRPPTRYCRTVQPSISSVKRLLLGLPKPLRVCGVNAATFAHRMRNNTWPTDALGVPQMTRPKDDAHNHACRAFAYGIVAKWPPPLPDDERRTSGRPARDRDGIISPGIRYGMSL